MRRTHRLLAALIGLAAAVGLVLFGGVSAFAGTTGTTTQVGLGGYQIRGNQLDTFNEVRGTVTLPASEPTTAEGVLADGMILQQDNNGGWTNAIGAVFGASSDCPSDTWTVMAGFNFNSSPGPTPLSVLSALTDQSAEPLTVNDAEICLVGGSSYYMEIHYSTKLGEIAFVAGPNEFTNASDLKDVFGVHLAGFEDPAIGVFDNQGTSPTLPLGSQQASFTRDGLTEPAGHNQFGRAGVRIPFAEPNNQLVNSTETGAAASVSNPYTLVPTGFGPGAAFVVAVPAS